MKEVSGVFLKECIMFYQRWLCLLRDKKLKVMKSEKNNDCKEFWMRSEDDFG